MVITWVLVVVLNHQILYTEEFDSFEGCQKQSHSKLTDMNNRKVYADEFYFKQFNKPLLIHNLYFAIVNAFATYIWMVQ